MGRRLVKGKRGKKANLIREDKVIERVALDIKDFRRVAILKGVTPQEIPNEPNNPYAAFHKKDLSMVNNDDMAFFIREHTAWIKKHTKALNRNEFHEAPEPQAPYAQLIRQRYPTVEDAIHDLDDALTTLALFAQLSANELISSERIRKCQSLLAEFHYYVAHTHALTKAFIALRGFYFEASIEGQKVMWLIPHDFTIPADSTVDMKVLLDFLELYENLVAFFNARQFIQLGMKYPPMMDEDKWNEGIYIDAIIDTVEQEEPEEQQEPVEEDNEKTDKLRAALSNIATEETVEEGEHAQGLFGKFTFTLDRGSPRNPLTLIIRSLGGTIVWDESKVNLQITHTVTDRPKLDFHVLNRTYIQTQWVFDCLNKKQLLDSGLYGPGVDLPPHTSPFQKTEEIVEGLGDGTEQADADGDDSDDEIDEEIRRRAMEYEFNQGIADETGVEAQPKPDISKLKKELKQKKQAERERLAAGTLPSSKNRLYKELKEKERKKGQKPTEEEENEGLLEYNPDNVEEEDGEEEDAKDE